MSLIENLPKLFCNRFVSVLKYILIMIVFAVLLSSCGTTENNYVTNHNYPDGVKQICNQRGLIDICRS